MRYHADLHIHSKYSRATSRDCDLEHLYYWARKKGIAVVGTGDFTHPAWRAELKTKLVAAEPGLYRLREDIEHAITATLPAACHGVTRFMLSVEISTIYKKDGATRKIHHLIYVPDLDAADRFAERLARIGNIASDGRPILGLDSRHLLEIVLETSPDAFLVPAHIWTPWFAVLGSRSGFDDVRDCYCDLCEHVFAVETGLSSDPAMNWRVGSLDRYRLVSNSDAHSPAKLGREATAFDTDLSYFALRDALKTGAGYVGTVEFFPEEGKYHLDGHRKCNVRLTPEETKAHGGRCPVCGEPVTVGVMHRVEALADRPEDNAPPPATAGAVASLVPLPEILSEIAGAGPASQAVERHYERLLSSLGAELSILEQVPVEDIARAESSLLAEGIARLRAGKVIREAGYDGEYGVIRLFEENELKRRQAGGVLFDLAQTKVRPTAKKSPPPGRFAADLPRQGGGDEKKSAMSSDTAPLAGAVTPRSEAQGRGWGGQGRDPGQAVATEASSVLAALDPDQRAAAAAEGPLVIVAGPGAGKTRVITHRLVHLIRERGVEPAACLAIAFTRRAAAELRERLAALLPREAGAIEVHTFHSLGLAIIAEHANAAGLQRGFRLADESERAAALAATMAVSEHKARQLLVAISRTKRSLTALPDELAGVMACYQHAMAMRNWIDFDDLVGRALRLLEDEPALAARYAARYRAIAVDEFQDVDAQQYRLLRLLAPGGEALCVIGDPDQAIYGFRGADAAAFSRFQRDYPDSRLCRLERNYRSSGTIVSAARQVIGGEGEAIAAVVRDMAERITIHAAPTARAEAEFVVHSIERMIGGHSYFSIDSGRAAGGHAADLSFADFAVLYRTEAQAAALVEALQRSGMPYQKHSHERLIDRPGVAAIMAALDRLDAAPEAPVAERLREAARRAGDDSASDRAAIEAALPPLLALIERCGGDGDRFAAELPLASEADGFDPRADRIALLTLHASKGLEFPVVFITGIEDGLLPLWFGRRDDSDLAEERRLFYVGMTRAQDRLILSRALKRAWRGAPRPMEPSPFLAAIESALTEHSRMAALRRKEPDRQLPLF